MGVNLNREDLEVEELGENKFKITLPPVEVVSCSVTLGRQYNESTTVSGDWKALEEIALYEATNLFVDEVAGNEVRLEEARHQARKTVRDLLDAVGIEADIAFKGGEVRVGETCKPPQPRDWVYDEEAQKWEKP